MNIGEIVREVEALPVEEPVRIPEPVGAPGSDDPRTSEGQDASRSAPGEDRRSPPA